MKSLILLLATICATAASGQAQQADDDVMSYRLPRGWTTTVQADGSIQFSATDRRSGAYVMAMYLKAIETDQTAARNFTSHWTRLIVNGSTVRVSAAPTMAPSTTDNGWEIVSGSAPYTDGGKQGVVTQITATGYGKVADMIVMTNSDRFAAESDAFLRSVKMKAVPSSTRVSTKPSAPPSTPAGRRSYQFSTTNFDDGWTSTIRPDWVEVTKGTITVLLHFPKDGTSLNADPAPETNAAWDILVAPRYANLKNYRTAYIQNYQGRQNFGMGTLTATGTGRSVFVLLFRGEGGWIECIAPDKNAFINEFKFDPEVVTANSNAAVATAVSRMLTYNRFGVAASDLENSGRWGDRFSANTYYAYLSTGASAGMSTYASSTNFEFGANQTYRWEIAVADSYRGRTAFSNAASAGVFTSLSNWQVRFSEIEKKPRVYDVYFSVVRGDRILWMKDAAYGDFKGFMPVK
jgi:hypothetical protein